jgi:hypothetical protein
MAATAKGKVMIFVFGFLIAGAYGGWHLVLGFNEASHTMVAYMLAVVVASLLGLAGFFVGMGLAELMGRRLPMVWGDPILFMLVPVKSGSMLRGNCYLVDGIEIANGNRVYFYYQMTDVGLYENKLPVTGNDIKVLQNENETNPRLEIEYFQLRYPWMEWLGSQKVAPPRHTFYVPKGSVRRRVIF